VCDRHLEVLWRVPIAQIPRTHSLFSAGGEEAHQGSLLLVVLFLARYPLTDSLCNIALGMCMNNFPRFYFSLVKSTHRRRKMI
jgi:hypothetical protein